MDDKRTRVLHKCILDHLKQKGLNQTADIFQREARVGECDSVGDGFLRKCWGLFAKWYSSKPRRYEENPFTGSNISNVPQGQEQSSGHRTTVVHHQVNNRKIINRVANAGLNTAQMVHYFSPGPSRYQGVGIIDGFSNDVGFMLGTTKDNPQEISSGSSSYESDQDEISHVVLPRGKPLTHFLDDFPERPNICETQVGRAAKVIPRKVLRKNIEERKTTGQLRLKQKSNELYMQGGDVTKGG